MKDKDLQDRLTKQIDFSLQRGSVMGAHFLFMSDIASLTIFNNLARSELIRARFSPHLPSIEVQESRVTIQYHDSCCIDRSISSQVSQGEVKLNSLVPWEIEVHGRMSNLDADLREIQLRSLDLLGSVNGITLQLSKPTHTSFIYMAGDIHRGSIHVPPRVGIRVRMSKSIPKLVFGNGQFGEIRRGTNLENSDFKRATSRYDITIAGEASNITIAQSTRRQAFIVA